MMKETLAQECRLDWTRLDNMAGGVYILSSITALSTICIPENLQHRLEYEPM